MGGTVLDSRHDAGPGPTKSEPCFLSRVLFSVFLSRDFVWLEETFPPLGGVSRCFVPTSCRLFPPPEIERRVEVAGECLRVAASHCLKLVHQSDQCYRPSGTMAAGRSRVLQYFVLSIHVIYLLC